MKIEIFKPLNFTRSELDLHKLSQKTGKKWQYASSGKNALFHCLVSLGVKGKILIPTYVCPSILLPINELLLDIVYYDIDTDDFNININDFNNKIEKNNISCVMVASMYGNPANLIKVEQICKEKDILLIDDAAQSFGAKLCDRYVGTFGDAGFFSFSPGKATSGHMGAFFWSKNKSYKIKKTYNNFFHLIIYWNFYFNRYKIYKYKKYVIFNIFKYIIVFFNKFKDLKYDDIAPFEKPILGGILKANELSRFREEYISELIEEFGDNSHFKIINGKRGQSNTHKIVLLFSDPSSASLYKSFFLNNQVYYSDGYELLDQKHCINALSVKDRVIELPLEDDYEKFCAIKSILKN